MVHKLRRNVAAVKIGAHPPNSLLKRVKFLQIGSINKKQIDKPTQTITIVMANEIKESFNMRQYLSDKTKNSPIFEPELKILK